MRCSISRALLPLHAGKDLPASLERFMDRHCASCEACRRERDELRAAMGPLADVRRERRGAAKPSERPDPLGENYWLEIRRHLRSEGLVRRPGEEAAPARRVARGAPLPGGQAVWGRAALALAAALLAGVFFLPDGFFRPEGAGSPEADSDSLRTAARGAASALASAAGPSTEGARPALDPAQEAAWKERARRAVRGGLSGASALPAGLGGRAALPGAVRGWVEETRSFTEPSLEFGLERWRNEPFPEEDEGGDGKSKPVRLSF
jgi:hypothetical protein